MESISSGCYVIDGEYNIITANDTAKAIYPQLEEGARCYRCLMGLDAPCEDCPVATGLQGPHTAMDPIRNIMSTVDAVELPTPGHGLCHMLVFSTVGEKAAFSATLPLSLDGPTDIALLRALTADYYDVISVHVPTGGIRMYRYNGMPVSEGVRRMENITYDDGIEAYAQKYVHPKDVEEFRAANSMANIVEKLREEEFFVHHYRVRVNGVKHYFFRKIVRVGPADSFEHIIIGIANEDAVMRTHRLNRKLEKNLRNVEFDSLTGLYTREAFIYHSEKLLRHYPGVQFDYCVCKLENLSSINHQYSREQGDRVLATIGGELASHRRNNNCIGYLGDGLFASFTPSDPPEVRKKAVLAFRDAVHAKSPLADISLKWSILTSVQRDLPIEEIMDKTMYALNIIRQDSNQEYIEFGQNVLARMEEESRVESGFEQALRDGAFSVWYQPKFSLRTGKICGAEALVRWTRPDGTRIPPDFFIPILEKCGRIGVLDEHVFHQACTFSRTLQDMGIHIPISVNLSRVSLCRTDIAESYASIADACGVDRGCLPIEITESAAVYASTIRGYTGQLNHAGFSLHLDDFGIGFSSLASLTSIPFTTIKLDKCLAGSIGSENNNCLLKHTVAYAKECGKEVIAEGVETYEQYLFLKFIGCDAIQGFYLSKPLPQDDFLAKLQEGGAWAP